MSFSPSPSCFVAIPKDSGYDDVNRAVSETLDEFGVMRVDSVSQTAGPAVGYVLERVNFVIADVTDGSSNTIYQLGVADGLRKPALVMMQKNVVLPSDLAGQQLLLYGPGEVSKLMEYLRYWISEVIPLRLNKSASAR